MLEIRPTRLTPRKVETAFTSDHRISCLASRRAVARGCLRHGGAQVEQHFVFCLSQQTVKPAGNHPTK